VAAIQAWLLDAPRYGLATASGALIAGIVSLFGFRWLKEERSETRDG
jgi:hypothetical protein